MRSCAAGTRRAGAQEGPPALCDGDVLLESARSSRLVPGLLGLAVALGTLLGLGAAALLYLRLTKARVRAAKCCDPTCCFLGREVDQDAAQGDCGSTARRVSRSNRATETKQQVPTTSTDVAAFALKAKVVYPINQRYRPLADGASNPSLHENAKLGALHPPESSSSSSLGSLSQGNDDEDSSQLAFPSPVPRSLQNERFPRTERFPQALCCPGFEGRISLYCLGLQSFQQLSSELLEQKHTMFPQVLRIVFNEWFRKDKMDSAFYSNILLLQDRELEELEEAASAKRLSAERNEEVASGHSTLEDVERAGRDRQEYSLQMAVGFSRQLERLCRRLHERPGVPPREGLGDMIHTLVRSLLLAERGLAEVQNCHMKSVQEKMLRWEELACCLHTRTTLLRQEAACSLRLVAKALERLGSDGRLSFCRVEKMLSDLRGALREDLQSCSEECMSLTKELLSERCRKTESKRKKLMKTQAKERSRTLDTAAKCKDPQEFVKVHQALLLRQRKDSSDLEDQQDEKTAEAVCELWQKIHLSWSEKLAQRVTALLRTDLREQTGLTHEYCERLGHEVERDLGAQLCHEEAVARQHLDGLRDQLEQDGRTWAEEAALVSASLTQLGEQQLKILRGMVVRQRDVQESGLWTLMEGKQRLLLAALQRLFAARHFGLRLLKEMRLSRLKLLSQYGSRAVELEDCSRCHQGARSGPKEPALSEGDKRQAAEALLVTQGFQQEFLSELDTGTEFAEEHAQLLVGHALAHSVRRRRRAPSAGLPHPQLDEREQQVELAEAVSESVYASRASVATLIHSHYAQMQSIMRNLQQEQHNLLQDLAEESDKRRNRLTWSLQKDLADWGRKPSSIELQQRVDMRKKMILSTYDLELEAAYERMRKKKSLHDQMGKRFQDELQEAQESFLSQLAAMARVPLFSRGEQSEQDRTSDRLLLDEAEEMTTMPNFIAFTTGSCTIASLFLRSQDVGEKKGRR
ncbi:ellis-van Creveld syndrome protein isoform X3 [Scleropages formosus]|uniref:ellis-van Creveld syndrome protein isoform X3 n=2 Tax=Scleropages formosus TaxID=113540 RepID=UPI0010FAB176|nr:ellis-van Creveld syndrome protein isoform X3 [Scleropages formosus]